MQMQLTMFIAELKFRRTGQSAPEGRGVSRGKGLLVVAIMDLVTRSCESGETASCFRPMLPGRSFKTIFTLLHEYAK